MYLQTYTFRHTSSFQTHSDSHAHICIHRTKFSTCRLVKGGERRKRRGKGQKNTAKKKCLNFTLEFYFLQKDRKFRNKNWQVPLRNQNTKNRSNSSLIRKTANNYVSDLEIETESVCDYIKLNMVLVTFENMSKYTSTL